MSNNLLNKMGNTAKKDIKNNDEPKKERSKTVQINYSLYKRLRMISAKKEISIKHLINKSVNEALKNKTIYNNNHI